MWRILVLSVLFLNAVFGPDHALAIRAHSGSIAVVGAVAGVAKYRDRERAVMKVTINTTKEVTPKELRIYCKVVDDFSASLVDADGQTIAEQSQDYVPSFMPGEHFGDYVILNIDIETGQVTNWKKPDESQLRDWIEAHPVKGREREAGR